VRCRWVTLTGSILAFSYACGGSVQSESDLSANVAFDGGDAQDGAVATDGSSGVDGSTDAKSDAAVDASSDATSASCIGPCLPGDSTCVGGQLAQCTKDSRGCNVWGTPTACATNQICTQTLHRAACVCMPGTADAGNACVAVIGAPQQIAPLSTATVTSQKPTLHWKLAPGTDAAVVDVCRDRACTNVEATFTAGSSGAPPSNLTPGTHYWRARGKLAANVGTELSPVWQFRVGARTAKIDSSWGQVPDVDGDGFADVVVGAVNGAGYADYSIYSGGAGGIAATPAITHGPITGYGSFDLRGVFVAGAGDTNGDGYADVLSTTLGDNANGADVCILHLFLGGPSGLSQTSIDLTAQGSSSYAFRGPITASAAGDVNGDGYGDIIATASFFTQVVYVFLGGKNGPSTSPLILTEPNNLAPAVGGAGDVNGDGYGDVLVESVSYDGRTGNVYLHLGGPSGPSTNPIVFPAGGAVAGAGDVNGDGLADFVIGPYLYFGSLGTIANVGVALTPFAAPATAAGDVNGDGFGDIIGGAPGFDASSSHAYVYLGGLTGASTKPIDLAGPVAWFGSGVLGAGDVDGDGYDDVLVSAPIAPAQDLSLFVGSALGTTTSPLILGTFNDFGFARLSRPRRHRAG
jgi:hypothetical protein